LESSDYVAAQNAIEPLLPRLFEARRESQRRR
jgi:hypothetical protein